MLNALRASAMRPPVRASGMPRLILRNGYSTSHQVSTKPVKRHPIRRFLLGTTFVLAVGYGGAMYYALNNKTFYYYFTQFVPFGEMCMNQYEDFQFNRRVRNTAVQNHVHVKPQESMQIDGNSKSTASRLPGAPAQSPIVKVESVAKNTGEKAVEKVESGVAKVKKEANKAESNVAPDAENDKKVPVSSVNGGSTAVVSVRKIDKSVSTADVDPLLRQISSAVETLTGGTIDGKMHYGSLVSAVNAANQSIKQLRSDLKNDYENRVRETKDAIIQANEKEYLDAKLTLVESYNNRLQAALNAVTERAVAAANNKVEAQHVELLRKFNSDINTRVETERDGRMGQLAELKKDVEKLQEAMLKSGQVLESENGVVSYFLELANLQRVLSDDKIVPLQPYLDSLVKALPSDNLLKAVIASVPTSVKQHGVISHKQLAARFQMLEPQIRQASLVPPDAGVGAHLTSLAASHLLVPKQGFPEGDDVESIIARTNSFLQQGDVTSAVSEVNSLQGWPKKLAADWLNEGRRRSEFEFLVKVLSDEGRLWSISRK